MQMVCISVNITGDDVTETSETFRIFFTLATPDIFQGGSNVTINIIDDDGKYIPLHNNIILSNCKANSRYIHACEFLFPDYSLYSCTKNAP